MIGSYGIFKQIYLGKQNGGQRRDKRRPRLSAAFGTKKVVAGSELSEDTSEKYLKR